jgi:perosamine synthetase
MNNLSWRFGAREKELIDQVLDSGFVSATSGNMNSRFENAFAEKMGVPYAIAFNSGTTTLHAALEALGVGIGDEVIIPALTVVSCLNAVLYCNAIPVFADVDKDTFNIDPKSIESKITERTKAIMPVHLYGLPANMTKIMRIAKKYNLKVVEDSAQCYLGKINGQIAGTIGDIGSWSLENSKHITTGDGGIITTKDRKLAEKIRKLGSQGYKDIKAKNGMIRKDVNLFRRPDYVRHDTFGFMYRLPEVAAAIGLAQVERMKYFVRLRQKMAKMYNSVIGPNISWLKPQKIPRNSESSYFCYTVSLDTDFVKWDDFSRKFIEYGGEMPYAAWQLLYNEGHWNEIMHRFFPIPEYWKRLSYQKDAKCENAEYLQPRLMQFQTNQHTFEQNEKQAYALHKTIKYYNG